LLEYRSVTCSESLAKITLKGGLSAPLSQNDAIKGNMVSPDRGWYLPMSYVLEGCVGGELAAVFLRKGRLVEKYSN
jgi:hypothetical protein